MMVISTAAFVISLAGAAGMEGEAEWLAGDHHVHSRFSATYKADPSDPSAPPLATLGGDGPHTIVQNGAAAGRYGLAWMVSTDHGGPGHSAVNSQQAYPELLESRRATPGVIQFYGMEFDTPGSEHSSLIIPMHDGEREMLRHLEATYGTREPWPVNPARDTRAVMLEALREMDGMSPRPVVIANHPSRSATGVGVWGEHDAESLRDWHDAAPRVIIGMEGAPGHQATSLKPDGERGIYRRSPTMGGFDQMTATVGGVWDALLGEGRRWWITATSDSHRHWSEGGDDFWPGEYSKTYVKAAREPDAILEGLRAGRVFVTTGDLISELDVTASSGEGSASSGETLTPSDAPVEVAIRLRDPAAANAGGLAPEIRRIDLIVGEVTGPAADRTADTNPTARVAARFTAADWSREGEVVTVRWRMPAPRGPVYLRVRGTSGEELEPAADPAGEAPWSDLWFYSNPIFIEPR